MRPEVSLSSTRCAAPAKEVPGFAQAVSMYFLIQTLTPGYIDMDLRQSGKPEMNLRLSISGPASHAQMYNTVRTDSATPLALDRRNQRSRIAMHCEAYRGLRLLLSVQTAARFPDLV